ncbi:MAG TPA: preprotein translocase subunit SecG [Candidatus Saccharimonadales bacterium]|jgi:preprotein translocase subunit SecG|nr:preprotein translocase subunit SecG [Candidatus Saccharimonadales bacterium]
MTLLNYITIGSMIIMTILILVQTRGASLGAGLGGSGEINMTRRGTDKTLFQLTIIMIVTFVVSLALSIAT